MIAGWCLDYYFISTIITIIMIFNLILILIFRNLQQMPEGGPSLMSAETWDLMHEKPVKRMDAAMFVETNFSQGGVHFYG